MSDYSKYENIIKNARFNNNASFLTEINNYSSSLGMKFYLDEIGPHTFLPFHSNLIGNPMVNALHGGVIAGLMENACIFHLLWELKINYFPRIVHISFDFLSPPKPMDTYARVEINRKGRNIVNLTVKASQPGNSKIIALGNGSYILNN